MEPLGPSVEDASIDGHQVQVLREPATGSEAWILPSTGASSIRFATTIDGQPLEVIPAPADWDAFVGHPTLYGAAVLFPFPGRIRGGRFGFEGQTYQLPLNEPERGNAIHGCVARRPWALVSTSADESGPAATYRIGTDTTPEMLEQFPFPFRLTLTVRVFNGTLSHHFVAENLGDKPMPMGLGLHPYVSLPLGGLGQVDDCEIWIDAPYYWPQEGYIPIGDALPSRESIDLRAPRSLRALASVGIGVPERLLNFVHAQFAPTRAPAPSAVGVRCGVRDPRSRREVVVEGDGAFSAAVSYVPPTRDKISFEPHTCVPNAFNLTAEGRLAGTVTLGPREFWRGSTRIHAHAW